MEPWPIVTERLAGPALPHDVERLVEDRSALAAFDTERLIGGDAASNYFKTIPPEALTAGLGREAKVGAAQSYLFNAAPLSAFAVEWLERAFGERST